MSNYSPTSTSAAGRTSSPNPVPAQQGAPAPGNDGEPSLGPLASPAADAHRGRSLLQAATIPPAAQACTHCWSAMPQRNMRATLLPITVKLSSSIHASQVAVMHRWNPDLYSPAAPSEWLGSAASSAVERTSLWRQHCMHHALLLVKRISGLSNQLQSLPEVMTVRWRQHCMQHLGLLVKLASDMLNQLRNLAQTVHIRTHLPNLEGMLQLPHQLLKQTSGLLIQLGSSCQVSMIRTHLHHWGGLLQFRGQPWWPFLPWQKAPGQKRAGRLLAEAPSVDLIVTVTVPAGQNSSQAISNIEGPAFAPSLQQSLYNEGMLQCSWLPNRIHMLQCSQTSHACTD